MSKRLGGGALVVGIWAALNGVLAAVLFAFRSASSEQERAFYWAAVAILVLTAVVLFFMAPRPERRQICPPTPEGRAGNGAPAAAFAAACLAGGFAWVFGVYVAYFALPLIAFCLARWRVEWASRRK